jgi:hypothetical protein
VLSQFFHIGTGPITTNNAFSPGNNLGHQLLLFFSQVPLAQLLAHERISRRESAAIIWRDMSDIQ